ncbi:MAG: glycosyltransferase family 39 protein [Candidatus Euphemobacter frigidus]|nr:glycosyltransferase family 39 protein [Candidatus Euphemobacter frigidus]MDP8275490.1 glycosyltransferase family 39 protein [Candidatus Euphemobacter frigidus]
MSNTEKRWRWGEMLLILTAGFLLFWAVGDRGLWAAEGRWAEINREMFLSGDFFHPTINGEPYFDKPLLTYWLISLVALVTGSLNEWSARIPSALAALAAVWVTMRLGRRLWSPRVGQIAGWFLLTGYGFLFWSRTATAESENLLAVILCVAWYWARRDRPTFTTFFVFWLIAFLGALTKGLTAVVVPVLAILPDLLRRGRWRVLLKPAHILALVLGVMIYLAPFVYASLTRPDYGSSGLTLVFEENILRYFKPFDHRGPIHTYLYQIPLLFLPWTPLFLAAVAGTLAGWKKLDEKTRWLIQAIALIFLFFSLSGSRRSYYILPILPFIALWTSIFIVRMKDIRLERYRRWGIGIQGILLGLIAVTALAGPLVWPLVRSKIDFVPPPHLLMTIFILGVSAVILGTATLKTGTARGVDRLLTPLIAAAAVLLGGYFCFLFPAFDIYRTERSFALELRRKTAGIYPEAIAFYPDVRSNMIFYLGKKRPVRVFNEDETEELVSFLVNTPSGVIIAKRRYHDVIIPLIPNGTKRTATLQETVHPWESKKAPKRRVAWFFTRK